MKRIDKIIYVFRIVYIILWFVFFRNFIVNSGIIEDETTHKLVAFVIYISIMYLIEKIIIKIKNK